jgi:hypothetical protein
MYMNIFLKYWIFIWYQSKIENKTSIVLFKKKSVVSNDILYGVMSADLSFIDDRPITLS